MGLAAQLLEALHQNEQADKVAAVADRLWAEPREVDAASQTAGLSDSAPTAHSKPVAPTAPTRATMPELGAPDSRAGYDERVDKSTPLILPEEWTDDAKRNEGAHPEPSYNDRFAFPPPTGTPKPKRRPTWIVLVLVAVLAVVLVVFVISREPTEALITTPNTESSTRASSESELPLPLPTSVETGVEKFIAVSGMPADQTEVVIKPWIGNSTLDQLRLERKQIRLFVEQSTVDPGRWLPPGGFASAGVPSLVQLDDRTVWAIPMNNDRVFDSLDGGRSISWATIFYDGTDGLSWTIPPSPPMSRAWQLTFYLPATTTDADVVGFGVTDLNITTALHVAPFNEWPSPECPCTWW